MKTAFTVGTTTSGCSPVAQTWKCTFTEMVRAETLEGEHTGRAWTLRTGADALSGRGRLGADVLSGRGHEGVDTRARTLGKGWRGEDSGAQTDLQGGDAWALSSSNALALDFFRFSVYSLHLIANSWCLYSS